MTQYDMADQLAKPKRQRRPRKDTAAIALEDAHARHGVGTLTASCGVRTQPNVPGWVFSRLVTEAKAHARYSRVAPNYPDVSGEITNILCKHFSQKAQQTHVVVTPQVLRPKRGYFARVLHAIAGGSGE